MAGPHSISVTPSLSAPEKVWLRPEIVGSWREIALVLLVTVGPFAWKSAAAALQGSGTLYITLILSERRLLLNALIECVLLALFLAYLHFRGWKKEDFKIHANGWSSLQGVLLLLTVMVANFTIVLGLSVLIFMAQHQYHDFLSYLQATGPQLGHQRIVLSWPVLVGSLVLNAFFEELICTAYAFNQFAARRGPLFALLLTVLLRMSCHAYQGPIHVLGIGAVFTIFGLWYWRTRNLWPLVFGHALLDILSCSAVKLLRG